MSYRTVMPDQWIDGVSADVIVDVDRGKVAAYVARADSRTHELAVLPASEARVLGLRLVEAARRLEEPATPVAGLVDADRAIQAWAGAIEAWAEVAAAQRVVVRALRAGVAVAGFVGGYAAVRWVTR